MRSTMFIAVLCTVSLICAAEPPATRPAGEASMLILPLRSLDGAARPDWIAEGIQQNLLNELTRAKAAKVLAPANATPAADTVAATAAGREASATLVLWGSYQIVEGTLRATAQLTDVALGRDISAIKATGPVRDLFAIEDNLAEQLRRAVAEPRPAARKFAPVVPENILQIAQGRDMRLNGPLQAAPDAETIEQLLRRTAIDDDLNRSRYWYDNSYGYWPSYFWGTGWWYPIGTGVRYNCVGRSYRESMGLSFSGSYHFKSGSLTITGGAGQRSGGGR